MRRILLFLLQCSPFLLEKYKMYGLPFLLLASSTLSATELPGNPNSIPSEILMGCNIAIRHIIKQEAHCSESDGSISIEMAADNQAFSYIWSPNIGVGNANEKTGLPAGTYQLTIISLNDPSCISNTTIVLGNADGPEFTQLSTNSICGQTNGTAQFNPSSFEYLWNDGTIAFQRSGLAPGLYQVTVTEPGNSCTDITEIIIIEGSPLELQVSIDTKADCNSSNGTASALVTGGSGNYTYSWGSGASIGNLSSGIYSLTVTDNANGCTATTTFAMTEAAAGANVTLNQNVRVSCNGLADGNAQFTQTLQTGFVQPARTEIRTAANELAVNGMLAAGWHCILVYDGNNCLAGQHCFEVNTPDPIQAVVEITDVECAIAGAINLQMSGGHGSYRYNWTDLPGAIDPKDRSDLQPGTYQVAIRDAGNCTMVINNIRVGNNCIPPCNAEGGTITTSDPVSFCVEDGTADLVDVEVSGNAGAGFTYLITTTNGNIINISDSPPFNFEGTGVGTVLIYGIAFDNTISGLGSGNNINDLGGCFDLSNSISIEKLGGSDCPPSCVPPVISNITVVDASCLQANGSINIELTTNPALYEYIWLPIVNTSNVADNLSAGIYNVTISDPSFPNCLITQTISVADVAGPQATFTTIPATCNAADGSITFSPDTYSYEWADGFIGHTRSGLIADNYSVTVTDMGISCSTIISVELQQSNPLNLSVTIDTQPTCGNADGAATISVTGGSGDYIFSWGAGSSQSNLPAGTTSVTVTDNITDCVKEINFDLIPSGGVSANISLDPNVAVSCFGANDGDVDFTIAPDPGFVGPPIIQIMDNLGAVHVNGSLAPGSYCLLVSDANGCLAGEECFIVAEPAAIQINTIVTDKDCNTFGAIEVTASGGSSALTYDWADLAGSINIEDRTNLEAGNYSLTITDQNGCSVASNNIIVQNLCVQNCIDPVITSITSRQSNCGTSTGSILLELTSNSTAYNFQWNPAVSTTNRANNLAAGLYIVTITDTNNNSCSTITQVLVSNADGPEAQVVGSSPATCQQANGTAVLSPASYTYEWCNGDTGPTSQNLSAGTCFVTVTDPTTNCSNILEVVIDAFSPLSVNADIIQQPTCQQANGQVNINVSGGSTSYSYIWSDNGSTLASRNDLPAGSFSVTVADNGAIGCIEIINFTLTDQVVQAQVNIISNAVQVSCAGAADGEVQFGISPGPGFVLPASSLIVDGQGQAQLNGELAPGNYCILIRNGNGCIAGSECFEVGAADPISLSLQVTPRECTVGGMIQLDVSGGTGNYTFDWLDLPGTADPQSRADLLPGVYIVNMTDENGCTASSGNIFVANICVPCPVNTQAILPVVINQAATYCVELEYCFDAAGTSFSLAGGGTSGSSTYGNFVVDADGCLDYIANGTAGIRIDTVCVVAEYNGLFDTTCLLVNIYDSPFYSLATDTLYINTFENQLVETCLPTIALPNTYVSTNPWFNPLQNTGTLTINPVDTCFTFLPSPGQLGSFIDTMGLVLCDVNNVCDSFVVIVSVFPANCDSLLIPTALYNSTSDCAAGAEFCLDIELLDIINYSLLMDGLPYSGGFAGCNFDTMLRYELQALLDVAPSGPYRLLSWSVNGNVFNLPVFQTLDQLVAFMNFTDPTGNWQLLGSTIAGGKASNVYGQLVIRQSISMIEVRIDLSSIEIPRGTQITVDTGLHMLTIEELASGCMDTLMLEVLCEYCPSLYTGNDTLVLGDCNGTASLCLDLQVNDLLDYVVTDNGTLYNASFDPCNFLPVYLYTYALFSQPFTYTLQGWSINGLPISGANFTSIQELVDVMNQFDPAGNWQINGLFISGGAVGNVYGSLLVTLNGNVVANVPPLVQSSPNGVAIQLQAGTHQIIVTNTRSACADTINVVVSCIPGSATDSLLNIVEGHADTICVDVSTLPAPLDTIFNNCPTASGTFAVVSIIDSSCVVISGIAVGIDSACIVYCGGGECDTLYLTVEVLPFQTDIISVTVEENQSGQICLDTTELGSTVDTIYNICLASSELFATYTVEQDSFCISYTGLDIGTDTSCWVVCDVNGFCDTTILIVNVLEARLLPPVAVDDDTTTFLNKPVFVDVLINDTLNSSLLDMYVIFLPLYGQTEINPDFTITYLPNPNTCNVLDSFSYVIETVGGADTATVTVFVSCDELRIFSGFSPNGDGFNDVYNILGIENFPDNEVMIFNRWGNEVFSRKGYTNTNAWDGTWKGSDLPDGTYFYVIRDGKGNTFSGYIELHR